MIDTVNTMDTQAGTGVAIEAEAVATGQLTVSGRALVEALRTLTAHRAGKAVPTSEGVRLSEQGGRLVLNVAWEAEWAQIRVQDNTLSISDGYNITLPYRELLSSLDPKQPVHIAYVEVGVRIEQAGGVVRMVALNPSSERANATRGEHLATIAGLGDALRAVAYAASKDKTRPSLYSIQIAIGGGRCEVNAADGYRVARRTLDAPVGVGIEEAVYIPEWRAGLLAKLGSDLRLMRGAEGEVIFEGQGGIFGLAGSTQKVKYPDLRRVIPEADQSLGCLDIDALSLTDALTALKYHAKDWGNSVCWHFDGASTLTLAVGPLKAPLAERKLAVEFVSTPCSEPAGTPRSFALNLGYVLDAAKGMAAGGLVHLYMPTATSGGHGPVALRRELGRDENMAVIMPMHMSER